MPTRVVFNGKQLVNFEEFESKPIEPNQVRVRGLCSLISTGTENIVLNRLFAAGTHWDDWIKYPFYPGYCYIGEVVEIGPEVTSLNVGNRVAMRSGHASEHVANESDCFPIPDGVSNEDASWFALAKIAFMGARVADYKLGDSVLIIGAGPIGQMSARWASAAGAASVIVVDPVKERLAAATAGGATYTIAGGSGDCAEEVRSAGDGKLPRVVIDGTGFASVFTDALGLAADRGTVVILGDTGFPAEQHLSTDVIRRGLRIIGAHDGHNDAPWDNRTISALFFNLVATKRFHVDGLISHTFPADKAEQAYTLLNSRRGDTMGVLFDWTKQGK